jgi:hypothetical protein
MSESTIGILVLLGISFVVSAVTHCFCHRFIFACFLSTLVAMLLFQFAVFLHLGHLDPFFLTAVTLGGSISFVIALVVGAVVRQFRQSS